MTRHRRTRRRSTFSIRTIFWRLLILLVAIPAFYLTVSACLAFVPVNRNWTEPVQGDTVYLISNGIHTDLILPVAAQGLDWRPLIPRADMARPDPAAQWLAFGMGERKVYLETPRWRDVRPGTLWAAAAGGERVMHVEWVADPAWHARAIRLRPEEYRRLWSAIRAGFKLDANGRVQRIDHPGYGPGDAFYQGVGRANAINTCNVWTTDRLRLAGVKSSLWSPFPQGFEWRYRKAD